jgi:DNA-binding beta-propeller fold protein YncE
MVFNVGPPPSVANTVLLEGARSPSAVAFDPVSGVAVLADDDATVILNPAYTAVDATIRYPPGNCGTTKHGIAVSPEGGRALVVHEDSAGSCPVAPTPTRVLASTLAPSRKSSSGGGHKDKDKCEKRRKHRDGDRGGNRGRDGRKR